MQIRKGRMEDASAAAMIRRKASLAGFSYISRETVQRLTDISAYEKKWQENIAAGPLRFLVAQAEEGLCAMLSWQPVSSTCGEVVSLHLLPVCWGSGLSHAMMETALSQMREAGLTESILWTFEKNVRARGFYEKMGFSPTGEKQESLYDGEIELCYRKKLTD